VVGVLADLSGMPNKALPPIAKRKFVAIDRDNINDVMKKIGPRLAFKVPNRLSEDDTKLNVELNFESMDDFSTRQDRSTGHALRKLLELRTSLATSGVVLSERETGQPLAGSYPEPGIAAPGRRGSRYSRR